jgi:ribosomal protein S18 acetylase RimI-like enzyme
MAALAAERDGGVAEERVPQLERDVEDPDAALLVAEAGGDVVAYARARHVADAAPPGWYLLGVIVRPDARRRGIGRELTRRRLEWIGERAPEAFYFVNERNRASIDLHAELGFVELARDFSFPGVSFDGGSGIVFRAALRRRPGTLSS